MRQLITGMQMSVDGRIEGPGWAMHADLTRQLAVARLADGHPETVAASAHLFAVATTT